eukprot:CAMPEP_0119340616 /NCGR_PEP_ID=MMETSP1333-20130426/100727_1 /TAXON_ID=418940 /ORGANISM="Scyphosphaera apsteinii, Strain RCC1455" /LENGTH=308 /DNA_ID=CAMNT_0007352415 /DNA_START=49 /DNA_END=975 /DNA_ORIENTATION=-
MAGGFPLNMPEPPDEQLRLGLRMIEHAYEEKARTLEHEVQNLRAYGKERDNQVALLERRLSEMEMQVAQSEQRTRELTSENATLSNEVRLLQERASKLDQFKRSIMQSINEDEFPVARSAAFGSAYTPVYPGSMTCASMQPVGCGCPPRAYACSPGSPPPIGAAVGAAGLTSEDPPTGRHGGCSTHGCGFGGAAGSSGPAGARAISACIGSTAGEYPVQQGPLQTAPAVAGADPESGASLDGKDFFRSARLRLTYEQFNQFLGNIKRLNDHAQSRDDTLQRVQDIFGRENDDLFMAFKNLLTKHGLVS